MALLLVDNQQMFVCDEGRNGAADTTRTKANDLAERYHKHQCNHIKDSSTLAQARCRAIPTISLFGRSLANAGLSILMLCQSVHGWQSAMPLTPVMNHRPLCAANTSIRNNAERRKAITLTRTSSQLSMALIPLPVEDLEELIVTGVPSGDQYATYFGRTKREKYNQILESSIVMFLGVFFSYFLSFVLGGFVATIFGFLFTFWGILSPDFKARQRNWEFLGGRELVDPWIVPEDDGGWFSSEDQQGLYGAFLLARVDDACVVENMLAAADDEYSLRDFDDYTMDGDKLEQWAGSPYLIRMRIIDDSGRELQIHARLSENYLDIEPGMPAVAILLSKSRAFSELAALTDVLVPDASCCVGDYPYLNRAEVESLLAEDDELWNILQEQGSFDYSSDDDDYNDYGIDYRSVSTSSDRRALVPARRRKR